MYSENIIVTKKYNIELMVGDDMVSEEKNNNLMKYKGMLIPNDWIVKKFKDAVVIKTGQVNPTKQPYSEMYHVGLVNIEKYTGRLLNVKKAKEEKVSSGKYLFQKGDVLFGKIRPELAKVCYTEIDGICSADIYPLKETEFVDSMFLKYVLLDMRFYQYSVSSSMRTGLPKVNREDLGGFDLILPPKAEQKVIATILSTWDKAIDLKENLIEQKKEKKKGLMQKLLTGEVRLPGFNREWKKVRLGEVLKERKEIGFADLELLAITSKNGVVRRTEVDIKDNSSEDKSKYKRILPNDIGYNTMRMWQGVSGVSKYEGIVSPAYTILKPTEKVNSDYMGYLFKLPSVVNQFKRHSQGLVNDTLNLKYENLKVIKIVLPMDISEQVAIANVLKCIDREIGVLQKQLNSIKQQKKGLMQQLLTGRIRVKV
ncbi:restriction endonuclease subunit S [Alkalihalobacterium bogoriense]|uniref:restriction endonuclease subunit S n=1 Tax=Alkalihalobacterium bogoriense TaxID=246272 RepID=UPI000AE900FB|nr:restriction endonuclease subunit S [Alkalihalobacterium bogoriense]